MNDLPDPDDVLVLANGIQISPLNGKVINKHFTRVPNTAETSERLAKVERELADLPAVPEKMNTIGVVLMYHLFGLSDKNIAIATKMSETQVRNIKRTNAFAVLEKDIIEQTAKHDSKHIQGLINEHAESAVKRVVSLIDSDDEDIQLKASKDILDRAGFRPADVILQKTQIEGGLRIQYIQTVDEKLVDAIDVTPNVIENE